VDLTPPSRHERLALLGGYLLLLVALTAGSEIRRVGDDGEYLDMMQDLLRFEAPSRHVHFWFYPALAVPFLALIERTSISPFAAFIPLNFLLLAAAFWVASGVLTRPALALLFVSPIVWWADKAHTEAFTFSLLTIALVAIRPRAEGAGLHPGWAVVALAAAGTQNPPFLLLAPMAALLLVATGVARVGDRRFLLLSAVALVLAVLHPAYYYVTSGALSGLSGSTHGLMPNIDEWLAVLRDTNLGLVPNAPALALAMALAVAFAILRSPRRATSPDVVFACVAGAVFLASFPQTRNFNHGATPGMSRYALWLIPLTVPFLRRDAEPQPPRLMRLGGTALVAVSAVWSVVMFHPERADGARPTWISTLVWKHYPWLDRPLPEVFAERHRSTRGEWWLPIASPDCTKILLLSRGESDMWPIPCFPEPVPAECREGRTLCYANRRGTAYEFDRVPRPSYWNYRFDREAVWTRDESRTVRNLLLRLRWWELPLCNISENRIALGAFGVGGAHYYCGSDRLLAYFRNREGARIRMRLRERMAGALIDAATGQTVSLVEFTGKPGQLWDLPIPPGPGSVVLVLTRSGSI
jgi:hypothetical protein